MEAKHCSSCKKDTTNDSSAVNFPCPKCAGIEITRCTQCRSNAIPYLCPQCEFKGPN